MTKQFVVDCNTGQVTEIDVPDEHLLPPIPVSKQLAEAKNEVNQLVSLAIIKNAVSTDETPIALRYTQNAFLYYAWLGLGSPEIPDITTFSWAYTEAAIYAEALAKMSTDNPLYEQYGRCSTPAKILAEWGRQAHLMDVASSEPFFAARREALLKLETIDQNITDLEGQITTIIGDLKAKLG